MPKFIKVTTLAGETVLINTENIFSVCSDNNGTEIFLIKDNYQTCKRLKEAISEIESMLEVVND